MPDVHHRQNYQGENEREPGSQPPLATLTRQEDKPPLATPTRQEDKPPLATPTRQEDKQSNPKTITKVKASRIPPRFHSITMTRNIKQVVTNITMITVRPGTKR
jgi:hypothetical protein